MFVGRATEQLVGLPGDTADEREQHAAVSREREQEQNAAELGGRGETDLWLTGRVALAKALMDVGELGFG